MKIFVFGSSISSSYWNGAATYYRGIYRYLNALGHQITFAEPDIYARQSHRDLGDFSYVNELVYRDASDIPELMVRASQTDLVVKHSGVGAFDQLLEEAVLECGREGARVAFWDVDAPATLARLDQNSQDPFRSLIPQYDFVFTYGGGEPVVRQYLALGARNCHPIYNALDPDTHYPVEAAPDLFCDLAFIGNRLPDRETRVDELFLAAAALAPDLTFLLGGEGWAGKKIPPNVRWIGHVTTAAHNRVNCSAGMVLNINRDSMARVGFSPPTRIFEAAGAGACLITDAWSGIDAFFETGKEILVAASAEEIVSTLRSVNADHARGIGRAMRERALFQHTYEMRAAQVNELLKAEIVGTCARGGHVVGAPGLFGGR